MGAYVGYFANHIARRHSINILPLLLDNLQSAVKHDKDYFIERFALVAFGFGNWPLTEGNEERVNVFKLNLDQLGVKKQREALLRYFGDNGRFSVDIINKIYAAGLHNDKELWEKLSVLMYHNIQIKDMYTSIRDLAKSQMSAFSDDVLKDYLLKTGERGFDALKNGASRENVERLNTLYRVVGSVKQADLALLRGNLMCLPKYHNIPTILEMMREKFANAKFSVEVTSISENGEISTRKHSGLTLAGFEKKFGPLENILEQAHKRETAPGTQFISRLSVVYKTQKQVARYPSRWGKEHTIERDIVRITKDEITNRLRYEYGDEKKSRKRDQESALTP